MKRRWFFHYKFWFGFKETRRRNWARRNSASWRMINGVRGGYLFEIISISIICRFLHCMNRYNISIYFIHNFVVIIIFLFSNIPWVLLIMLCGLCVPFKLLFWSMTIYSIRFKVFRDLTRYTFWWILNMHFTIFLIKYSIARRFGRLRRFPFIFRHYYILAAHSSKIIYIKLFHIISIDRSKNINALFSISHDYSLT